LIDFVDAAAVSELLVSVRDGSDEIDWIVLGYSADKKSLSVIENMRVIISHVKLLDEALDLVCNDSSGVLLSFTHYNGTPLALLLHLMLQNSLFSSSSSTLSTTATGTSQTHQSHHATKTHTTVRARESCMRGGERLLPCRDHNRRPPLQPASTQY
jgi:hypothetical protein